MGWAGLKNGDLMSRARAEGFEILLTGDRNMEYQQNIPAAYIALVVLEARTNRLDDLLPLMPSLLQILATVQPGQVVHVTA